MTWQIVALVGILVWFALGVGVACIFVRMWKEP